MEERPGQGEIPDPECCELDAYAVSEEMPGLRIASYSRQSILLKKKCRQYYIITLNGG